eukprot:Blabericola_migrator_1__1738@NODE_146_length_12961_cov_103_787110_g127_i0_p11_GENE_NODE_146_length_12961_cov_103_787110_g127_i0NODE_146_length_12961_cov_103_787110_g127_i0_p11_ORF_typecomplete_len110_score21_98_NODE_146_length_12961_cov_103_787110_g127_i052225551
MLNHLVEDWGVEREGVSKADNGLLNLAVIVDLVDQLYLSRLREKLKEIEGVINTDPETALNTCEKWIQFLKVTCAEVPAAKRVLQRFLSSVKTILVRGQSPAPTVVGTD